MLVTVNHMITVKFAAPCQFLGYLFTFAKSRLKKGGTASVFMESVYLPAYLWQLEQLFSSLYQ